MRVAQFIARFLAERGVRHVFTLTGGGAMFLNDAIAYEGRLQPVYCHHEQACAMAAEGYARIANAPGVINVTTGPGSINALNGVYGAFTDSIPMLILSGQVKRATHLLSTPVPGLRQLGDQEVDIASMARPVCKAVFSLLEPRDAPEVMARAWALAMEGRPGPVWIDVPIDVQSAELGDDVAIPPEPQSVRDDASDERVRQQVDHVLELLQGAKRPLFLWGTGVRLSNQQATLLEVAQALQVPVCTGWTHDTISTDHPLFAGRPGTIGTRAGNFVLQAADLIVVLGSRLNVRQTSYNFESFASRAHVVQVDVDAAELGKPLWKPAEGIVANLAQFAPVLRERIAQQRLQPTPRRAGWLSWIAQRKAAYPVVAPHLRTIKDGRINPYWFIEELFRQSRPDDIFVSGNATACIVPFQVAPLTGSMRLFSNSGAASMGYDIPAAVGAAVAAPDRRVISLAGDGSAQLNIQELQTLRNYGLNMKIVVLSNEGYLSIRSSQLNFFKRTAGESAASGVTLPDYCAVARGYGLPAFRVSGDNFAQQLAEALTQPGPGLIEAMLDGTQGFEPRMSSRQMPDGTIVSPVLEDMHPFLDRDELARATSVEELG